MTGDLLYNAMTKVDKNVDLSGFVRGSCDLDLMLSEGDPGFSNGRQRATCSDV